MLTGSLWLSFLAAAVRSCQRAEPLYSTENSLAPVPPHGVRSGGTLNHRSWRRSRRRRRRQLWAPRISISTLKLRLAAWSSYPAFGCVVESVVYDHGGGVAFWFLAGACVSVVVVSCRSMFVPLFSLAANNNNLLVVVFLCLPQDGRSPFVCYSARCGSAAGDSVGERVPKTYIHAGPCLNQAGSSRMFRSFAES